MFPVSRLARNLIHLKLSHQLLYVTSLLILFWVVFDSVLSYLVPILITERGYTNTEMGLIIAFSSLSGAAFDLFLSKYLRHTHYLRLFLLILVISFIFPLVLWSAHHLFVYLLAMAIWGLYYDLYTFASYDFVSRNELDKQENSFDFSVIELFRSIGCFVAPLLTALFVTEQLNFFHFSAPLVFLVVAAIFYVILMSLAPATHFHDDVSHYRSLRLITEVKIWEGLGKILLPVLIFMVAIYIFDATFWTIGPLFAQSFPNFPHFSSLLMVLFNLPALFTAWKVDDLTKKFGKKRTAFISFLIANTLLIPIGWIHSPVVVLILVFLAAIASSITWPSIESAFADYVAEAKSRHSEVEGIADFTTNVGYILGPILAGFFSDRLGIASSFTALGLANVVLVLFLLFITPRYINIVIHRE